jgi:lincosamide nucleotidyltransferase A/C/D/E
MGAEMMRADDVIGIYKRLTTHGIQVWLTGGWGIDALLGEQTRDHKDLDLFLLVDDVFRMRELLSGDGYGLKELWSENRFITDVGGVKVATAFVLQDSEGREIDAHALRFDDRGRGIPAWDDTEEFVFTKQDLAGDGRVAGISVRCISFHMQLKCHTGYQLPKSQVRDLELLNKKIGVG